MAKENEKTSIKFDEEQSSSDALEPLEHVQYEETPTSQDGENDDKLENDSVVEL